MKYRQGIHPLVFTFVIAIIALIGSSSGPDEVAAQSPPLPKLAAADGAASDGFGHAVDSDVDLLAVGTPYADIGGAAEQGAAYIFARDVNNPSQWHKTKKLTAGDGQEFDQLGITIAIHGDTVVVGAPYARTNGTFQQGAVYVFERNHGGPDNWGEVKKLTDNGVGFGGLFGSAVALENDLLVVGAQGATSHRGTAFLFGRNTGGPDNWGLIKALTDPNGLSSDEFGSAATISGDTIIIGAERADVTGLYENDGAAFIFERNEGGLDNWGLVTRLTASDNEPNDFFGGAVALAGDRVVVGAWSKDADTANQQFSYGAAYIFERNQGGPGSWGEVKKLTAGDGAAFDFFGRAVALNGDQVIVGSHQADVDGVEDRGAVYLFQRDQGGAGNWGEVDKVTVANGGEMDYFGHALAVNGSQIMIGAYGADSGQGAVYLHDPTASPPPPPDKNELVYLPLTMRNYVPPTGTLTDGGVVTSETGAIIGAVEGTLAAPVRVAITAVPPPLEPLNTAATPVGDYYFVNAETNTFAPVDKPFVIGLPVPPGAQPENLAVQLLSPAALILDFEGAGQVWQPLPGAYDSQNNLFVVTLSYLLPGGSTLILTQHPEHEPLALPSSAAGPQANAPETKFTADCLMSTPNAACSDANKQKVADEAKAAYDNFVGQLGFKPPALSNVVAQFTDDATKKPVILYTEYYSIGIVSLPCLDHNSNAFSGVYHPSTMWIHLCESRVIAGGSGLTETIRHELFHAIQHAYSNITADSSSSYQRSGNSSEVSWLVEGTAEAAQKSITSMQRSNDYNLRQITISLGSEDKEYEYQAQDFWVATGQALNESPAFLKPIFEAGATPAHVSSVLSLDTAYWDWVKNQVFEKAVNFGPNGFTYPACQPELQVIGQSIQTDYPVSVNDPVINPVLHVIPPLTAFVVEIYFTQEVHDITITATALSGDPNDLKYKIYIVDAPGEPDCRTVPDGERTFETLPQGSTAFVVLANVSYLFPPTAEVRITGPDG